MIRAGLFLPQTEGEISVSPLLHPADKGIEGVPDVFGSGKSGCVLNHSRFRTIHEPSSPATDRSFWGNTLNLLASRVYTSGPEFA